MAKIAWLVKRYADDEDWIFTTEEPDYRWVAEMKQIVYFEVEKKC